MKATIIKYLGFFLFFFASINKTNAQKTVISGYVTDSLSNQKLKESSVFLFKAKDLSPLYITLVNSNGKFEFTGVPLGKYVIKISFTGYKATYKFVNVLHDSSSIDLGQIKLQEEDHVLDSVDVTSSSSPIVYKKDTVEYTADSFQTRKNATVEELLKLLPGFQVTPDGEIIANGKKVTQIFVDNKLFFNGSTAIAIKNLPAEIIDKIQLYNGTDLQSQFTGIKDGRRDLTLNLKIKKDRRKGYFGKAAAGIGTNKTYNAAASMNRFNNNDQISVFGQVFNNNKSILNSIPTVQSGGNGINKNINGGINFRNDITDNFTLYGSYLPSYTRTILSQQSEIQNIFPDDSITTNNITNNGSNETVTHNMNLNFNTKFHKNNMLTLRQDLAFTNGNNNSNQNNLLYRQSPNLDTIYKSQSKNKSTQHGTRSNTSINYSHNFKKPLRSLSASVNYNYSNQESNKLNNSFNQQFIPKLSFDTLNQKGDNLIKAAIINTDIQYSEPIGKNQAIILDYNYENDFNKNDFNVFKYDNTLHSYNVLDSSQSNTTETYNNINNILLKYQLDNDKQSLMASVMMQFQNFKIHNISYNNNSSILYKNIIPSIDYTYHLTQLKYLHLHYDISSSLPDIGQLQPINVTSDSLYIYKGNPNLKQTKTHNLSFTYQINTTKRTDASAGLSFNYIKNNIQNSIDQLSNGVQVITPVNLNGGAYSINGYFNYSISSTSLKTKFNFNTNLGESSYKSILNNQYAYYKNKSITEIVTLSSNLSNLLSLNLTSKTFYNMASYGNQVNPNFNYLTQSFIGKIDLNIKNLTINSDFNFTYNGNIPSGYSKWIPLLNPSIGLQILKSMAEIQLSSYDILNKNRMVYRSVTSNTIQSTSALVRNRYFMLSFIYNFRKFPKGKN